MTGMSTQALVVISPATTTMPVFASDSHATRAFGSCAKMPSRIASEMASQSLSGWPSVTDSDVKRYRDIRAPGFLSGADEAAKIREARKGLRLLAPFPGISSLASHVGRGGNVSMQQGG